MTWKKKKRKNEEEFWPSLRGLVARLHGRKIQKMNEILLVNGWK